MSQTATLALTRTTEGEWIVLRSPASDGPASRPIDLAESNYTLRAGWKYVIEFPGENTVLRHDSAPASSEGDAGFDFEQMADSVSIPEAAPPEWLDTTAALIADAGWACHRRDDRLALPVDGYTAEAAPDSDGFSVFTMQVSKGRHNSDSAREAAALLLLRAGGAVRMASGYFSDERAGFIARVPPGCGSEGIGDALAALAHCARYYAKEVSALGDEQAAAAYLALGAHRVGHS